MCNRNHSRPHVLPEYLERDNCRSTFVPHLSLWEYDCGLKVSDKLFRADTVQEAWQAAKLAHDKHHSWKHDRDIYSLLIHVRRDRNFTTYEAECDHVQT